MITQEIQSLDFALLFEMQRQRIKTLSFVQAWRVCAKAAPKLPCYKGPELTRSQFISELIGGIENIQARGYGTVEYSRNGKIISVSLKKYGIEYLNKTVFSFQERMGDRY